MQTHIGPRPLKGNNKPEKDVQAFFSVSPNKKIVIFIHGYGGNALNTWGDFCSILPNNKKHEGIDILFYGYDGLRADFYASAAIFRDFLSRLLEETKSFLDNNIPPQVSREINFKYEKVIIVAHSLGAAISRRALIDATKCNSKWVTLVDLILYAPAHNGARVDLLFELIPKIPFLKRLISLTRFASPLIDQLKPGSKPLSQLLNDTEKYTQNNTNGQLIARKVIIAEYEKIVENDSFGDDPPPETIPNTCHTTVCKPRSDFMKPATILECHL